MIDHVTIQVKNLEKSKAFYEKVLATLGYKQNITNEKHSFYGFGPGEEPVFEIVQASEDNPAHKKVHVCFRAKTKDEIKEFHRVAIEEGGKDNGLPGPREEYTPTYYATFVIDPDDNNIEVCLY